MMDSGSWLIGFLCGMILMWIIIGIIYRKQLFGGGEKMDCVECGKNATRLVAEIDHSGTTASSVYVKEYIAYCNECYKKI